MQLYMKNRRLANKAYAVGRLGGACSKCGTSENLQFDHMNPSTKTSTIANMLAHSRKRINEELVKCQLLCANCHKTKTRVDMGWKVTGTHGTINTYKSGCRCDSCGLFKRESQQRWRKSKK